MRPVRISRGRQHAIARRREVALSVTQEQQLLGSGRRPVEQVEEEQRRTLLQNLLQLDRLAVLAPDHAPRLPEPDVEVVVMVDKGLHDAGWAL
jgi:flagellar biosynthesis/type III secretory pathway chaperone